MASNEAEQTVRVARRSSIHMHRRPGEEHDGTLLALGPMGRYETCDAAAAPPVEPFNESARNFPTISATSGEPWKS